MSLATYKYVLVQAALPDYRVAFVRCLQDDLGSDLTILAGADHFAPTVRTDYAKFKSVTPIRNFYLLGRRVLFQPGALGRGCMAEVAVLELNPRITNTWIVLCVRRLLRRPTVLWGHATGRDGKRRWSRRTQERLASSLIMYTDSDRELMKRLHPGKQVYSAPNSLYSLHELPPVSQAGSDLIYVGRLVPEKRCRLMIEGYAQALKLVPDLGCLIVVGSGPQEEHLRRRADELCIGDRVGFLGEIGEIEVLAPLYAKSFVALSPGYVGLAATQAALLGVPILVADNEPHAPEISLLTEGFNAYFFTAGDASALASRIEWLWAQRADLADRRQEIADRARSEYTAERMASGFARALRRANN